MRAETLKKSTVRTPLQALLRARKLIHVVALLGRACRRMVPRAPSNSKLKLAEFERSPAAVAVERGGAASPHLRSQIQIHDVTEPGLQAELQVALSAHSTDSAFSPHRLIISFQTPPRPLTLFSSHRPGRGSGARGGPPALRHQPRHQPRRPRSGLPPILTSPPHAIPPHVSSSRPAHPRPRLERPCPLDQVTHGCPCRPLIPRFQAVHSARQPPWPAR